MKLGATEIILILAVVLLLFGGKKLPELARGLGKGIREFKDASEGVKREIHRNINSFDTDEEDRKADENRKYREPEIDHSHSIHDEPTVSPENQTELNTVDVKEESKEPKNSI